MAYSRMFDGFDDDFVVPERKPRPAYLPVGSLQELCVEGNVPEMLNLSDKSLALIGDACDSWASLNKELLDAATDFVQGNYIKILQGKTATALFGPPTSDEKASTDAGKFKDLVHLFRWRAIQMIVKAEADSYADADGSDNTIQTLRSFLVILCAAACLSLYVQANWTGPELDVGTLSGINPLPYAQGLLDLKDVPTAKAPAWYRTSAKEETVTPFTTDSLKGEDDDDFDDKAIEAKMRTVRPPAVQACLAALQVGAHDCYEHCEYTHFLVTARAVLASVVMAAKPGPDTDPREVKLYRQTSKLWFSFWIAGRAALIHQRSLVDRTVNMHLFDICTASFRGAAEHLCPALVAAFTMKDEFLKDLVSDELVKTTATDAGERVASILEGESGKKVVDPFAAEGSILESLGLAPETAKADTAGKAGQTPTSLAGTTLNRLTAQLCLEWGHAQHFFRCESGAKTSFLLAKRATGLETLLTGALGRRTKFQKFDLAQLVLRARSVGSEMEAALVDAQRAESLGAAEGKYGAGALRAQGLLNSSKAETGASDDSAARVLGGIQQVKLDDLDASNILLEKVEFRDPSKPLSEEEKLVEQAIYGSGWGKSLERPVQAAEPSLVAAVDDGPVSAFDQCVIMALCLDIKNHNPSDGLTQAEMRPFVERAVDTPLNWMVYSTGLLVKSWLEFENHRTMERAILQVQALVDQHTNKLTPLQSSQKVIDDGAPVADRMRYIYGLVFPSRWELKRQLADRYRNFGVLRSSLQLYEELEMWDEIIDCHVALERRKRAEKLLRKRIEIAPSPRLLCLLGQVLNDDEFYLQAWELSKGTYAKAKLDLGRRYFNRRQAEDAVDALKAGLAIAPHQNKEWYLLGLICMQLSKLDTALHAFSRVVQLEPNSPDAWANIGSIHLHSKDWKRAYAALDQAIRMDKRDWRMWSNFLIACMQLRNYARAIFVLHEIIEIRSSDDDNERVSIPALGLLVQEIVASTEEESHRRAAPTGAPKMDATASTSSFPLPPVDLEVDDVETAGASAALSPTGASKDEASLPEGAEVQRLHIDMTGEPASKYLEPTAKLFGHITSVITNQPKIWQLYAILQTARGRRADASECKLKMCRSLQKAGWEKDEALLVAVVKGSKHLVDDYMRDGSARCLLQARHYLTSVVGKVENAKTLAAHPALQELKDMLAAVEQSERMSATPHTAAADGKGE